MTDDTSLSPPSELIVQWSDAIRRLSSHGDMRDLYIAAQAARWGADQELEACCAQISQCHLVPQSNREEVAHYLQELRRPSPKSLKAQAQRALDNIAFGTDDNEEFFNGIRTLQEALDQLPG